MSMAMVLNLNYFFWASHSFFSPWHFHSHMQCQTYSLCLLRHFWVKVVWFHMGATLSTYFQNLLLTPPQKKPDESKQGRHFWIFFSNRIDSDFLRRPAMLCVTGVQFLVSVCLSNALSFNASKSENSNLRRWNMASKHLARTNAMLLFFYFEAKPKAIIDCQNKRVGTSIWEKEKNTSVN